MLEDIFMPGDPLSGRDDPIAIHIQVTEHVVAVGVLYDSEFCQFDRSRHVNIKRIEECTDSLTELWREKFGHCGAFTVDEVG